MVFVFKAPIQVFYLRLGDLVFPVAIPGGALASFCLRTTSNSFVVHRGSHGSHSRLEKSDILVTLEYILWKNRYHLDR